MDGSKKLGYKQKGIMQLNYKPIQMTILAPTGPRLLVKLKSKQIQPNIKKVKKKQRKKVRRKLPPNKRGSRNSKK